jgi:tetratricopeptide (TPR) repeat protein
VTPEPSDTQLANSLYDRGYAFAEAGDNAAAVATYDELLARFADRGEHALRTVAARAMVARGVALSHSGLVDDAVAALHETVERFVDETSAEFREQVALCAGQYRIHLGEKRTSRRCDCFI